MDGFILAHGDVKSPIDFPVGLEIFPILPESDCQPGKVGGAKCGGFGHFGPDYRHAQQVSLKLHEQVVGGAPPSTRSSRM